MTKTKQTKKYTAKEANQVLSKLPGFTRTFNKAAELIATAVDAILASTTDGKIRVNTKHVQFKSFPDNEIRYSLTVHVQGTSQPLLVYLHLDPKGKAKSCLTGNGTAYPLSQAGIRRMANDILSC